MSYASKGYQDIKWGRSFQPSHREEREMRAAESQRISRMAGGGEEEWKNIHTMLNCISAMVDKTKRAITILQQRGVDPISEASSTAVMDIRRQTEEKVSEFKRNAEEAVNQVRKFDGTLKERRISHLICLKG